MPQTLVSTEVRATAERMQHAIDAHAQIRAAMRAAPTMSGRRNGDRKLPVGMLERPSVVVFPDLWVLKKAFQPFLGDVGSRELLVELVRRRQLFLASDVEPLIAVQILRAPEGGYEFIPLVVAPDGAPSSIGELEVVPCRGVRVGNCPQLHAERGAGGGD